jgi:E3 ubiquitin-protein ligase UHRF1
MLTKTQPPVGGIYGTGTTGAFSVALSGGYEDDVDEGFRFTFTGSGGRDLSGTKNKPKNLRTAPQTFDQTLTGPNLALKVSCDTGNPIRVIRGYKAELGPSSGFRYDGLYQVVKCWQDTGKSGFKVWRYAFKRIDGQKPLDTTSKHSRCDL